MARKIEQIQQENIAIQKELDALKALTEREEKEKKKSELDLRIQHAKKEVSSQYQAETDQNMREKIKAEENKLESFSTELGALGAEVQGEQPAHPEKEVSKAEKDQNSSTENPWTWKQVKDFVSEQWTDVWDADKWKTETGKNTLRAAGFVATGVWAVALVYKGLKSLFWDEKKEKKSKKKRTTSEETSSSDEDSETTKKDKPWRKKALARTLGIWGAAAGGLLAYKNWDTIKWWFLDVTGKNLNKEEALAKVTAEVKNGIIAEDKFWVFSAHFDGITYDETTWMVCSYGEQIPIDIGARKIVGLDVQFSKREELFHAANIVNFCRRKLRWRGANAQPFVKTESGGDICFNSSAEWKQMAVSASGSDEWKRILWTVGTVGGGLLGAYLAGVGGGLAWAVAGGVTGTVGGAALDDKSSINSTCSILAKEPNLSRFISLLNQQKYSDGTSLWAWGKEYYEPDNTSPIHPYLNKVKKKIDEAYWKEDSVRRDLSAEVDPSNPSVFIIKSYGQSVKLSLEGDGVISGGGIDFDKIQKISLWKYDEQNDWWSGLNLDFPHNESGLKEAIMVANLTNKIREEFSNKAAEMMPFSYGDNFFNFSTIASQFSLYPNPHAVLHLDVDTPGPGGTTLLSWEVLVKDFPTLLKDLSQQGKLLSQETLRNQAKEDKKKGCSQYIKYLHQMLGEGQTSYWKVK